MINKKYYDVDLLDNFLFSIKHDINNLSGSIYINYLNIYFKDNLTIKLTKLNYNISDPVKISLINNNINRNDYNSFKEYGNKKFINMSLKNVINYFNKNKDNFLYFEVSEKNFQDIFNYYNLKNIYNIFKFNLNDNNNNNISITVNFLNDTFNYESKNNNFYSKINKNSYIYKIVKNLTEKNYYFKDQKNYYLDNYILY